MPALPPGSTGDPFWISLRKKIQDLFLESLSYRLGAFTQQSLFIGGTALARTFGSKRLSDDLNFLISEGASEYLRSNRDAIAGDICAGIITFVGDRARSAELAIRAPSESKFERDAPPSGLKVAKKKRRIAQFDWVIEFSFEDMSEVVRVKPDFRVIPDADPVFRRGHFLRGPGYKIWTADSALMRDSKIAALIGRPSMKWRDVFDLGYLHMVARPGHATSLDDVLRLPTLTHLDFSEFLDRLGMCQAMISNTRNLDGIAKFTSEMQEVLPASDHPELMKNCASSLELVYADLAHLAEQRVV